MFKPLLESIMGCLSLPRASERAREGFRTAIWSPIDHGSITFFLHSRLVRTTGGAAKFSIPSARVPILNDVFTLHLKLDRARDQIRCASYGVRMLRARGLATSASSIGVTCVGGLILCECGNSKALFHPRGQSLAILASETFLGRC